MQMTQQTYTQPNPVENERSKINTYRCKKYANYNLFGGETAQIWLALNAWQNFTSEFLIQQIQIEQMLIQQVQLAKIISNIPPLTVLS